MNPINYLNDYILPTFKQLLIVENKEIILIKENKYQELSILDNFGNIFKLSFECMMKNDGLGKFEINDKHYKYISNYVLRNINKHRETNKFYRELITLSSYLIKYNIKPLNLKKLRLSPDFLIEDEEKNTYLIEIFFSKDNNDWKKDKISLDWSISNSNEDLETWIVKLKGTVKQKIKTLC